MVSKVRGGTQEIVQQDGRTKVAAGEPRIEEYDLISPFVHNPPKKGEKMPNVHPFWAVIKCKSSRSVYNMELAMEQFFVPHTMLKGASEDMLQTTVTLPVLKNCEAIEEHDVLTVRYAEDEEER